MSVEIKFKKRNLQIGGILLLVLMIIFASSFLKGSEENLNWELQEVEVQRDYISQAVQNSGELELVVDGGTYEFVEGRKTDVYAYNGQIPGPFIWGKLGDTRKIKVVNNLDVPTSVHWHGLQLENVEDGVPEVTQEPIAPGERYEYIIEFRNPGLYWYHSHVDANEQVESGLQGAILVSEENIETNVLVLDDVLVGQDYQFREFDLSFMHGRFGNIMLVNGENNPEIKLKNNRIHLVNTANARSFNIQFNGKEFEVVGMDIGSSERYMTNVLTIHPGERYEILLPEELGSEIRLEHYTNRGSVRLADLKIDEESFLELEREEFQVPFNLEKLLDRAPDEEVYLKGFVKNRELFWTINDKYYPENPEKFEVSEGSTVKMRIKNTQGQPHPMHLHGQKFLIIARNGVPEENLGWKDTVMVWGGEEVDIVFIAEERGKWVFHCHILEHAEAGMLSVLEVV